MKHLAFNLLMLVGMTGAAQSTIDFETKKCTLQTNNGYGAKRELVFKLMCTKEEIMNCIDYWEFIKNYQEEGYRTDTISDQKMCELFVMNFVGVGIINGKYKLKNPNSLDFMTDVEGMLYVIEDKEENKSLSNRFNASLVIKAQNGYGNYITGKFIIVEKKAEIFF
jgi:hypothetical protein